VYGEIKEKISLKNRVLIVMMMAVPSLLLRFAIEQAWNLRKKRLFIPMAE
jgi:signal transduction histidine kinase